MDVVIIAWVSMVGVMMMAILSKVVVMQTKQNQLLNQICNKLEVRNDD